MQGTLFQSHGIFEKLQVQPNIFHNSKCIALWLKSLYSGESLHPTGDDAVSAVGLEVFAWFCFSTEPGLEIIHAELLAL